MHYRVADLLDPPTGLREAFDLVVESLTAQSLPDSVRPDAIARIARMVAPGGTFIVIAGVGDAPTPPEDGPPWPLTRAEVESFASGDLRPIRIELVDAAQPGDRRWRAEFGRP